MVECTSLENWRGSHLRGFESLFLRFQKPQLDCGFFFFIFKYSEQLFVFSFLNRIITFFKDFGDGSVYMGWIGLFIGFIIIGNHHTEADKIGPAISVAFLPIFYGYFFKLISIGLTKKNKNDS